MRKAEVQVKIEGKDITKDLTPHLLSLSYTDKADDQLDDLQIRLEDRDRLWQGDWLPKTGDIISAKILALDFHQAGKSELDCGEFEVDELTLETAFDSGDIVSIKAVPACAKSSLMMERKTREWANLPLDRVAADVFTNAGLSLLYKAPEIIFERVEQRQESDLTFMQRITKEQGLRLCLKSRQAIIYSGQRADSLAPLEFERASFPFSGISFKKTLDDVYTQCIVGYTDAANSETTKEDFKPEDSPQTGKTLTINKRIENPAQAERVAKAELRDKNCKEMTASFSGMGDTRLLAGTVIKLSGWGRFDTSYVIEQASHSLSREGGYTTVCSLVKALDY